MTWYYQHHPTHLEIRMSFGYTWLHESHVKGARYKYTHIVTAVNTLRMLLDIQASIEMIVNLLAHVMTASQEECVEMAEKTTTDRSFCRVASLVYCLLTNEGGDHGRDCLSQIFIESVIRPMLAIYEILRRHLVR